MNNSLLPPLWGAWTLFLSCLFVGGLMLEGLSSWPVGVVPLGCFLVWLVDAARHHRCDAYKTITDSAGAQQRDNEPGVTSHQP